VGRFARPDDFRAAEPADHRFGVGSAASGGDQEEKDQKNTSHGEDLFLPLPEF
jgi:hypothetical protein